MIFNNWFTPLPYARGLTNVCEMPAMECIIKKIAWNWLIVDMVAEKSISRLAHGQTVLLLMIVSQRTVILIMESMLLLLPLLQNLMWSPDMYIHYFGDSRCAFHFLFTSSILFSNSAFILTSVFILYYMSEELWYMKLST